MIKYIDVQETRIKQVKRKAISIGKDAPAQNFARMFGIPEMLPGQDEMGYGGKITTDRQVRIDNRWYRVYATCYGNASSNWIVFLGSKRHLR